MAADGQEQEIDIRDVEDIAEAASTAVDSGYVGTAVSDREM